VSRKALILGPVLFLIFINDLELDVLNSIFKFADDTKILGKAASDEDCLKLQNDLNTLCNWSDRCLMKFKVAKCKVIHIHLGNGNSGHRYSINGKQLDMLKSEIDLGVICFTRLESF